MRPGRGADAWFRQPVVWLGAAVFAVSLVACVATIVLASRHADTPVDNVGRNVMAIPLPAATDAPLPVQERR